MKYWRKVSFILILTAIFIGCNQKRETESKEETILEEIDTVSKEDLDGNVILYAEDLENDWYRELPYMSGDSIYAYDVENINEAVGVSQYLFIGFVEEYMETKYDKVIPNTYYKVKVLECLKGDLQQNESYIIRKNGGINKENDFIYLESGDTLPLVGTTYIFRGSSFEDSINIGGINTNLPLEDIKANGMTVAAVLSIIQKEEIYLRYKEAVIDQEIPQIMKDAIEGGGGYESTPEPIR